MNTLTKNAFIKRFTNNFQSSKELLIIKYLTIIGIDYVNRYLKDSKNLEGDMRRISCKIFKIFNEFLIFVEKISRN